MIPLQLIKQKGTKAQISLALVGAAWAFFIEVTFGPGLLKGENEINSYQLLILSLTGFIFALIDASVF